MTSAMPLMYAPASTFKSSIEGISEPEMTARVMLASVNSFLASFMNPALNIEGLANLMWSASLSLASPLPINSRASSNSPRCTARIALAENRITSLDTERACSRSLFLSVSSFITVAPIDDKISRYLDGIRFSPRLSRLFQRG